MKKIVSVVLVTTLLLSSILSGAVFVMPVSAYNCVYCGDSYYYWDYCDECGGTGYDWEWVGKCSYCSYGTVKYPCSYCCGGSVTLPVISGTTGDCTWTWDNDGHLTISGNGKMESYYWGEVAPYYAPWRGSRVTSVTIEEGVTEIGELAFSGCTNLKSVIIPSTVTLIGYGAFDDCNNLTDVYISDIAVWCNMRFPSLDDDDDFFPHGHPFWYADNLYLNGELVTELTIPKGITTVNYAAFFGCKSLTSVIIPNSVTIISNNAFRNCTNLKSVTIPDSVTTIGDYAFSYCKSLPSVTIGDSVTAIGQYAFEECTGLTTVNIPVSVTSTGSYAFNNCTNLTTVYYRGTIQQRNAISKGNYNTKLYNATWYYEACAGSATHTYDTTCDTTCNVCKDVRQIEHTYDNACDGKCNVCSAKRVPDEHKIAFCSVTNDHYFPFVLEDGIYRSTNHGDLSSATITLTALYSGRVPIKYRTSTQGSVDYKDKLIIKHNDKFLMNASGETVWTDISIPVEAGDKIYITYEKNHAYSAGEDTVYFKIGYVTATDIGATCEKVPCAICGEVAQKGTGHKYTNACDKSCNTCGATRTIKHTYTNACDTSCNVCKATRTIKHDYKAATCTAPKTCKVCKATSGKALGHKYTNACDTSCNTCKATRKITHSYKTVTKKATTTANGYTYKKCSVCSKTTSKTTIYKASTIKLAKTAYVYNGKTQKPTVTVKDSKGNKIATSNYTVTYASGRKNVGTYKVTIKFKGKYSGTKTLTFKINPAGTTVKSLTAGTKKLTVKWAKKTTQVTGYEIQYSTSKSFKSVKTKIITKNSTTSTALTGLKAKTTYYVRVRTYKTVNGKKVYSGWTTVKYKKTK